MATRISHSPEETEALGEEWGEGAAAGWVIGLRGDLGAGKTQLVRGLARGLNVTSRVHSPTFSLVNIYSGGRLPLYHLDLYRLEGPRDIVSAGMEEYLTPAGVTVIEWIDKWFANPLEELGRELTTAVGAPPGWGKGLFRWVDFEVVSETERRITWKGL